MIGAGFLLMYPYMVVYFISIAAHRSVSDLCHHHALLVNFIITYLIQLFSLLEFFLA